MVNATKVDTEAVILSRDPLGEVDCIGAIKALSRFFGITIVQSKMVIDMADEVPMIWLGRLPADEAIDLVCILRDEGYGAYLGEPTSLKDKCEDLTGETGCLPKGSVSLSQILELFEAKQKMRDAEDRIERVRSTFGKYPIAI